MSESGLESLRALLGTVERLALAVSGGVDSTTLAVVAHRTLGSGAEVFHAVSPAVPPEATERVRAYAEREGWKLRVVDAGEFSSESYLRNPVDRCFFCKFNLYGTIASLTDAVMASGTNLDDLDDFRPGLDAARDYEVRHPFVEAGIDKAGVRAIARALELGDLAELPASPCLSSRIETGIPIDAAMLELVHASERRLVLELDPAVVRCRVRRGGLVVELDAESLAALDERARQRIATELEEVWRREGYDYGVGFEPYQTGGAFLTVQPG